MRHLKSVTADGYVADAQLAESGGFAHGNDVSRLTPTKQIRELRARVMNAVKPDQAIAMLSVLAEIAHDEKEKASCRTAAARAFLDYTLGRVASREDDDRDNAQRLFVAVFRETAEEPDRRPRIVENDANSARMIADSPRIPARAARDSMPTSRP